MFANKKFLSIFVAETILPWIVALLGIVDVSLFSANTSDTFEVMYKITMFYAIGLAVLLLFVGFGAFVLMLMNIFGKSKGEKYSVARPLLIWIYSGVCVVGTLFLLLSVAACTYGQSV